MRALFDVNVLIALHDGNHVQHLVASRWRQENIAHGWASCPLTQNGCLRIMAQPACLQAQPLAVLASMLRGSTSSGFHCFWADDASLLDAAHFRHSRIHSPRQLTGLYLLALAVRHGGRLATFDQRIPLGAVPQARAEHMVILQGDAALSAHAPASARAPQR